MKSDLKAKFLQHLASKKRDGGFTLIELLVVIIIIGILAAIALPSFLNQANKAKESEAKTYVGSAVRAQQAYFLENNEFASTMGGVELGINTNTKNYGYTIATFGKQQTTIYGTSKNTLTLRSFIGGVAAAATLTGEGTTKGILCRGILPATAPSAAGIVLPATATTQTEPSCGSGFQTEGK